MHTLVPSSTVVRVLWRYGYYSRVLYPRTSRYIYSRLV